jgi:hypothetical protein
MIGKLTEVGSFTTRIEVTNKSDDSAEALEEKLRNRLAALLPKVIEVETVLPKTT